MQLAKEQPDLLPLVQLAHSIAVKYGNHFSGSSVLAKAPGIAPNLLALSLREIVVKTGEAKQGDQAYYRLVDPPGVERALRELGLL